MVAETLTVVEVRVIPWPWNLKGHVCANRPLFEAEGVVGQGSLPVQLQAFAQFHKTLDAATFEQCDLHRTDWATASGMAISMHDGCVRPQAHSETLKVVLNETDLVGEAADRVAKAIMSFFWHPIEWPDRTPPLKNGNHRVCALKQQAVERCLVSV